MKSNKTHTLTLYAMLSAIIILMAFTPIGYLKVGIVQITFIMIPVVIGSVVLGPNGGAFLGFVFGTTSFMQCFGMDAFGSTLLGLNPFYTALLCFVPRILMGYACGWIFRGLQKIDKTKWISFIVSSASGALLNTALFVTFLIVLFGKRTFITENIGAGIWKIVAYFISFNAAIETGVCLVIGTAISKALFKYIKSKN